MLLKGRRQICRGLRFEPRLLNCGKTVKAKHLEELLWACQLFKEELGLVVEVSIGPALAL